MRILRQLLTARAASLIFFEAVILLAAVALAAYLRVTEEVWLRMWPEQLLARAALVALVTQVCLYYADLYELKIVADRRELIVRLVQALGAASLILGLVYFWA